MKSIQAVFALLVLVSVVTGCRNETTDDYKSDVLQKNLGQITGVQGRYSGMLTSNQTKLELGGLQITLKATEQSAGSNDENKATATPILVANVEFDGPNSSNLMIAAQDSYYDPNTGIFTADIKIDQPANSSGTTTGSTNTTSNNTETISINAVIHDGNMDGQLSALGYDDYGSTFHLTLNGPDINELAQEGKPNPNLIFSQNNYTGTATFQNGTQKPVNLVLLKPSSTSEEDFLNIFLPVKPVIATFNFGGGAFFNYANASWDQRTGRINGGTAPLANPAVQVSLVCQQRGQGFDCSQATAGVIGTIANIHVDPVQGTLQDPPDSSEGRDAITRVYDGDFFSSSGNLKTKVTITYPARTRAQEIADLYDPTSEKTLVFSYTIVPDMTTGATFTSVTWDVINKTLVAQQASPVSVNPAYQLYLSCKDFSFQDPSKAYDFSCTYLSTLRNENQTIHLHSN